MNIPKCSALLMLAYLAVTLAGNEKEVLIHVRPITRAQYESIMQISGGKPVIAEGRLIKSTISGLAGLAAGLQISKYLPNILSVKNENSEELGGYPLCTISTNVVTGRQIDASSYLNIDELTNSLTPTSEDVSDVPTTNCILVLDDGKGKPSYVSPDQAAIFTTTQKPTTLTMETPTYEYQYPSIQPLSSYYPYSPFYPGYPYYLHTQYPYSTPLQSYFRYNGVDEGGENGFETKNEEEVIPSLDPTEDLHNFIAKNLRSISAISSHTANKETLRKSAMKTTKRPSNKSSRRPAIRAYSRSRSHSRSKTKRRNFNYNLDEHVSQS